VAEKGISDDKGSRGRLARKASAGLLVSMAPPSRAMASTGSAGSAGASGARPAIRSAARSAMAIVGALVLPRGTTGITDASTTRRPVTPRTFSSGSTTLFHRDWLPMAQVPTGWYRVATLART